MEEDIRGLALLSINDPDSFLTMMTYEELDQYIEVMPTDIARQYKAFRNEVDEVFKLEPENAIVNSILNALCDMHKQIVYYTEMGEVPLTAALESMITQVLVSKYDIHTQREFEAGRALKKLGQTDLYFYKYENGRKIDLAILENKEIHRFKDQYLQLMGYLNAFFKFGITLSINRKYTLEEAKNKLEYALWSIEGDFSVKSVIEPSEDQYYLVSEHIVPETGKTLRVYHFILNLADNSRIAAAKEARNK